MNIPQKITKETVYFIIISFENGQKYGAGMESAYKTEKGALQKAEKLFASGHYDEVMVRKETVFYRDENNEFSTSEPYKIYIK